MRDIKYMKRRFKKSKIEVPEGKERWYKSNIHTDMDLEIYK